MSHLNATTEEPSAKPRSLSQLAAARRHRHVWLGGAALMLLVVIVYWPTAAGGYVWDDDYYVKGNQALRSLPGLWNIWFRLDTLEQYYPLVLSTFWVEYHLWGIDPAGYHIVNFLLHGLVAVLMWRLLVRLEVPGAWLAAALFAVHPVHVEGVSVIHELKNMISCLLGLAAILAYLKHSPPEIPAGTNPPASTARRRWLYYGLSWVLFVGALLSKTVVATVPAVLLVIYWWKRGRITGRDVAATIPFFAAGAALALLTLGMEQALGAQGPEWNFSLAERFLIVGRSWCFYAGKLLCPQPLIWIYPKWPIDAHVWWQYLFPLSALAAIAGLWLARGRIGRGPLAAVLIFSGVLVPGLGFFNLMMYRFTYVVDHIQYHASIAWIALMAAIAATACARLPQGARRALPIVAAALLIPLAVIAEQRTYVFRNNLTMLTNTVAQLPESWVPHYYLGFALQRDGQDEAALAHFRQAIELRGREADEHPELSEYRDQVAGYYVDVGRLQRQMGRPADAEISFGQSVAMREQLVARHPKVADVRWSLAWSYIELGYVRDQLSRTDDALAAFLRALAIRQTLARQHPDKRAYQEELATTYTDLALIQRRVGQTAESEASLQSAIALRKQLATASPAVASLQEDMAATLVDLGLLRRDEARLDDALTAFRQAAEIREALVREDAEGLRYHEGLAWCYAHLGDCLQRAGRTDEAEVYNRQAAALRRQLEERASNPQ